MWAHWPSSARFPFAAAPSGWHQDYVATELAEAAGEADLALEQRGNALVTRVALRSVQRIFSLVGSRAGSPAHPVSLAKRDIEMVSHHVALNWRQSAVRYLAATVAGCTA